MPGNDWQPFLWSACRLIFQKNEKRSSKAEGKLMVSLLEESAEPKKRIRKTQGRPGLSCLWSVVDNQTTQQKKQRRADANSSK